MGKEVKIGLAVIGVLLCVFGGVLFYRLRREAPDTAQRKVAAANKDGKAKSKKKEPGRSKETHDDRSSRFPAKVAWGTGKSESEAEAAEVEHREAPALDNSVYRDRSEARRGRYDDVVLTENAADESATGETDQENAREEAGQPNQLSMPDDRFNQQHGDGAFGRDAFSQDEEDRPEPSDAADRDVLAPAGEQEEKESATDRVVDRSDRGERMIESELDSSEPTEAESEAVRLSPLRGRGISPVNNDTDEDQDDAVTEVRPAANDRYADRRYEQDRSDDRFDRGRSDELDRDREESPREQEMADDRESVASEPVEERPARRRAGTDSYVVEPNDNFWRISQKIYGTGSYFKALEEHNRRQQGEKRLINVGDVLSVPPLAVLRENYPDLCPKPRNAPADRETVLTTSSVRGARGGRTYTVAEGDTLFDIARNELGKASRWAEIYRLNREQLGDDFNYLSPGMQLTLPERDEQVDPIASRPRRDGYRR